ncbi:MAG: YbhN family protein [Anaerolineales bacterium]
MSSVNGKQTIPEAGGARAWKSVVRRAITLVLFGLGVHLLLPQILALEQSVHVVRQMAWWAIGLAVVAQVLSYVAIAFVFQALVHSAKCHLPLTSALGVTLAGNAFGLVAGGIVATSAAQYRWLRERGADQADAAVAGGLVIQLNNLIVALLSLVGILHLLARGELTAVEVICLGLIALAIAATVVLFVYGRRHATALAHGLARIVGPIHHLLHRPFDPLALEATLRKVLSVWDRRKENGWTKPLVGAVLAVVLDMATLFAVFLAAGYPIHLTTLVSGYGLSLLLGKMVFLPGGVGVVEASMAALYSGLGVPNDVLVIVVLAYRLISFWMPNILGLVLVPVMSRPTRRPPKAVAASLPSASVRSADPRIEPEP